MIKTISKTLFILFLILVFIVIYLSVYGVKTKKFNKEIINNISNINKNIDLYLSDGVRGYLSMKDYTNSMSDIPLEEGADLEVVIANINVRDREIILSLRALEKQDEKSALKDNAIKNKEIEEATKSNIGDLIKAEMQDPDKEDE